MVLTTLGLLALIAAMLELLFVSDAAELCDTSCNGTAEHIWAAGGLLVAAGSVALLIATWLQHQVAMTVSTIVIFIPLVTAVVLLVLG